MFELTKEGMTERGRRPASFGERSWIEHLWKQGHPIETKCPRSA
jgi:hypothetical protein